MLLQTEGQHSPILKQSNFTMTIKSIITVNGLHLVVKRNTNLNVPSKISNMTHLSWLSLRMVTQIWATRLTDNVRKQCIYETWSFSPKRIKAGQKQIFTNRVIFTIFGNTITDVVRGFNSFFISKIKRQVYNYIALIFIFE